ncbi:MAG: hypothetical protein AAFR04_12630 [Pseudomonadota bacterium]
MAGNFHETYRNDTVSPPKPRATGIVFTVVCAIIALIWRDNAWIAGTAGTLGLGLALLSWRAPALLQPLNIAWFHFGMALHRVMSPVIMGVLFAVLIVPAGLIMQLVRDPLRRRRVQGPGSYWVARDGTTSGTMRDQF